MVKETDLILELAEKFGKERKSLLPILNGIIDKNNYLSKDAMLEVARVLEISAAEVYGTASFYSFMETNETGKYVVRVCKSIICDMKGKEEILNTIESVLKLKIGETSQDKRFTLLETNCLGLCAEGPSMLINDNCYTQLSEQKVREILQNYIKHDI